MATPTSEQNRRKVLELLEEILQYGRVNSAGKLHIPLCPVATPETHALLDTTPRMQFELGRQAGIRQAIWAITIEEL